MDRRIEAVLFTIEQERSQVVTVASLARSVGLSHSRLRHLFKQETGETLTQHIKIFRLRRAEILLRTTYLSIKEIADHVGLVSGSNFAREFKRMYGLAPTTYRKSRSQ